MNIRIAQLAHITGISTALFFVFLALPTHAATIRFEAAQPAYRPETDIPVSVFLDTEGEEVNAIEGTVVVQGALVRDVREGDSVLSLWMRRPRPDGNEQVPFAGAIPGGRNGDKLFLFSLILRADAAGEIALHTSGLQLLAHDGLGTPLPVVGQPANIRVAEDAPEFRATPVARDQEPPDDFTPRAVQDPFIAHGAWALVFLTQDKGSGVHHYEVFETRREITRETDIRWERTESPYVFRDQTRGNFVYLKAIDRVGNERIVRVNPARERAWHEEPETENAIVWGVGFIIILGYTLFKYPWRKRGTFYSNG